MPVISSVSDDIIKTTTNYCLYYPFALSLLLNIIFYLISSSRIKSSINYAQFKTFPTNRFSIFQTSAQSIWEVEASFGRAEYKGDFSSKNFSESSPLNSLKLGLRYNLRPSWALSTNVSIMVLTGLDNTLHFHTQLIEYNGLIEWFPFRGQRKDLGIILQPYLYAGIGVTAQKTRSLALSITVPSNFSTEASTFVPIHLGVGLRVVVSRQFGFTLNSGSRYTGVDNLDGVILGNNDDWYFDANIGVLLFLNKKNPIYRTR